MSSSSSSSPEIAAAKSTDPTPRFSYKDSSHDEVMEELSRCVVQVSNSIFVIYAISVVSSSISQKRSLHPSSVYVFRLSKRESIFLNGLMFRFNLCSHWFYEDFIREENPKFPSLPLKKFSAMLFHACPLLHQWSHDHEQAFNNFMQYKTRVPVCGAIMLNDTWEKVLHLIYNIIIPIKSPPQCVLVKGWKSSSGWGFPKGKINESEPPPTCAIREVWDSPSL